MRVEYEPLDGISPSAWGLIGHISMDIEKPDFWIHDNLLTNGDFENVSNLPQYQQDQLLTTEDEYTSFYGKPR